MKFIAITGGPGAGKTAVLEMARTALCEHVIVMPEAAGILFGGGFPRRDTDPALRAVQRAIFHVQRQMEYLYEHENHHAVGLCDRGTLDGLAYWPGTHEEYFEDVHSTLEKEYARYSAVIHLRVPGVEQGYNYSNELRRETPEEARAIDDRIIEVWRGHPHRFVVETTDSFFTKTQETLKIIESLLPPECCMP